MILGRSLGNRFSQGLCYSWAISGDAPFEFFPGPGPLPRNVENLIDVDVVHAVADVIDDRQGF
jgi:hypothetical protein